MARTYTRTEIRTRIRQFADMVNSRLVDDTTELNVWIDVANADYHEILCKSGLSYLETDTGATATVAGTAAYNLPSDFLGILKLEWRSSTTEPWRALHAVSILEDHRFGTDNAEPLGYREVGSTFVLYPTPVAGFYRLRYVPMCAKLTADSGAGGTIEGYNGWEQYVVIQCVVWCLEKEESFEAAARWEQKLEMLKARITAAAELRDATGGGHIVDVYNDIEVDPADVWPYRRRKG